MKAIKAKSRAGQAMLEYAMVVVLTLGLLVMTSLLLYTFKEHGTRVLDLVAADYP